MDEDRFVRTKKLLGEDNFAKLQNSYVVIVGLGAVGSYATEALARAGVGRLRLIDFDRVSSSNINRQLFALTSTVGMPKAEVAINRVRDINPDCKVESFEEFIHKDTMGLILDEEPDLVIDAIDSLNPKTELIAALVAANVDFISSMGAALRTDPTRIKYGKINQVSHCGLSKMLRKRLKRRDVDLSKVRCVYSDEPRDDLPETAISMGDDDNELNIGGRKGRERNVMGSLPTITGIFGLTIANEAIKKLTS